MAPLMVYGATGYTGRSIVKQLIAAGVKSDRFVCAGRNASGLSCLQDRLLDDEEIRKLVDPGTFSLQWRVFGLDHQTTIDRALKGVKVLVNAAGPFEKTALPLAKACVQAGAAYIDTSGHLDDLLLIESELAGPSAKSRNPKNAPLLCGTGFTPSIATEMTWLMKQAYSTAGLGPPVTARVGMAMPTRSSRGSARTALHAAARTRVYRDRRFVEISSGSLERSFPVQGTDARHAICGVLTLAEVHQLGAGLGIPNVECYFEMHALTRTVMAGVGLMHAADRIVPWRGLAERSMAWLPEMFDMRVDVHLPDPPKLVCVELEDAQQRAATLVVEGGDHYDSTAKLVVAVARDLMNASTVSSLTNSNTVGWASIDRQSTGLDPVVWPLTRRFFERCERYRQGASDPELRAALQTELGRTAIFPARVP